MTSSTNKDWPDTSVLPPNILSLQNYDFFKIIEQLAGTAVADLVRIQAIRNVRIFMLVPDLIAALKLDSLELDHIKSQVCYRIKNAGYHVKPGVEASLRYLRELFAAKISEYYKQPNDIDNDDNTSVGKKRSASSLPSEQISNKRGRK